jgi:hypothetical protein
LLLEIILSNYSNERKIMSITLDPLENYVPILKAKQGEIIALSDLDTNTLDKIFPLLEIPPLPWDFESDTPKKVPTKHINETLKTIKRHLGSKPFYLDFNSDLLDFGEVAGNPWQFIDQTVIEGMAIIPVTTLNRSNEYNAGVKAFIKNFELGCSIRVNYDLSDEDPEEPTEEEYSKLLTQLEIEPSSVDIVLDLGSIFEDQVNTVYWATRLVISETPFISDWRNFVVSTSSFPASLSPIKKDSMDKLERTEWLTWLLLYNNQKKLKRMPVYSDYSISHPSIVEIDPRIMNVTAGIRYTLERDWLIIRGRAIKQKDGYKYDQFRDLCTQLMGCGSYYGADYSKGDEFISECSTNPESTTGNLTTWRKVGNNHHFKVVVELLAKLPSS